MTRPPLRHRLEYAAFRVLRGVVRGVPEPLAMRGAALLGHFAGSVLRVRRREVDEHLARAFPDATPAWRRRVAGASYAHLAREAATLFRMSGSSGTEVLDRVELHGLDELWEAVESGEGVVLLTGHLGNWEVAGAALAASGVPLDVVGKGMANRAFEADLFGARERLGMHVIEMTGAPKGVLRALGRGRVVAMLGDQNAHRSGVFVPFFGVDAATARGPALFALRSGARLFYGVALRKEGWRQEYRVRIRPMEVRPTGDLEADIRALLTLYTAAVEASVREAPEQYFWQHKRWKTRPPGEAGLRSADRPEGLPNSDPPHGTGEEPWREG